MKISRIMTMTLRSSTPEAVTDHAAMIKKNMTVTRACYMIVKITIVNLKDLRNYVFGIHEIS